MEIGADFEQAIAAVDGSSLARTIYRRQAEADTWIEYVYRLPAATTFHGFAVPGIGETPSPSQTFTRRVEIRGGDDPEGELTLLASADLAVPEAGEAMALVPTSTPAVRVVAVRLIGGIEEGAVFFEFSEIVGVGTQQAVQRVDHFDGMWDATGGTLELHQDGATVTGCADRGRKTVTGTVTGNLLFATLVDNSSGVGGAFVAALDDDGTLRALRSDNGAPFRMYTGPASAAGTAPACAGPETPSLGCGDIIHGIRFGFDSAEILPESDPVLDALYAGLQSGSAPASIVGHTSTEGTEEYNQDLSERRAAAVVDALVARGIDPSRLAAVGRGETQPMADEGTEAGRALNRRVEVVCATE